LKTPVVLNVNENDWPGVRTPESHTPPFAVVVWLTSPLFVHMTVSPTCTWVRSG
jgi:hypothetical protein